MRWSAIVVLGALARVAHADSAEDLFNEGDALRKEGKTTEACAKFRASFAINPDAVGTMLNVALCYEQEGKIGSAHKLFAKAEASAKEHELESHRAAAQEHKDKLAGDVPRLTVAFAEQSPDLKLVVGEDVVDPNSASDIEVDPGDTKVVASAPGRVPYVAHVVLAKGEHKAIAIPKLGYPVEDTGRATLGKVVAISGGGVLLVGIGVGFLAHRKYDTQFSNGNCTMKDADHPMCNQTGYAETQNAKTLGWVGTGVGTAGLVAVGVGVALWLTAPHREAARSVSFAPSLAPGEAGVVAFGRF
ncbi:MAG: hypothetical protein JO257_00290 [Deltaproteobacteria bacterium]|nr:hypothetical protein [Deltaproteobacteria bacterium]